MFNNKGQSLILFVLIIPLFLLLFVLVIDVGKMISTRREMDNINYIAIDYGLKKINEIDNDKLTEIIKLNDNDINIKEITIEDKKIFITLSKKYKGHFLGLININLFEIKSSYKGEITDYKNIIERNK